MEVEVSQKAKQCPQPSPVIYRKLYIIHSPHTICTLHTFVNVSYVNTRTNAGCFQRQKKTRFADWKSPSHRNGPVWKAMTNENRFVVICAQNCTFCQQPSSDRTSTLDAMSWHRATRSYMSVCIHVIYRRTMTINCLKALCKFPTQCLTKLNICVIALTSDHYDVSQVINVQEIDARSTPYIMYSLRWND